MLSALYKGETLCTTVNIDIVDHINKMAQKLPRELEIFYDYSTYESECSTQGISFKIPVRSGFNVTIRNKSGVDSDNNFNLKFKLSSERTSDAVHYDGNFYMRFVEVNESTKRIVSQIKHLINYERQ